jgi:Tol biopolymer transport system component
MKRTGIRLRLMLLAALALPLIIATPASAQTDERCFPETGQCISGRFREFWEGNGGLAVFGYPTTPARDELNRDTGQTHLTQWFERERLELHPENPRPYDVLLGRLGEDVLLQQGRRWQDEPRSTQPQGDCLWFAETQRSVCDQANGIGFRSYWQNHGLSFDGRPGFSYAESLALFGLPLTEPRTETNSSGDRVLTQWFERARFEWHPDKPDQFKVLLGLLGNEARTLVVARPNPGLPGHLLIASEGLYDARADGSRVTPLPYSLNNGGLVVSRDGTRIAFRCSAAGGTGLCTANYNGSNVVRIGNDPNASPLAWSPNGQRIAYVTGTEERRGLYAINADGSGDTLLSPATPGRMVSSPSWSPDGQRLVFNTIYSETALYVVNADGSQLRQIAPQGAFGQWSPTGNRIVFESITSGNQDIYAINPDGSGLAQLTATPDSESFPVWSPDGTRIAYRWQGLVDPNPAGAPSGIYVMGADGQNPIRVLETQPTYSFGAGVWSPDGAYVAASRYCPRLCGPGQTWGAKADGSSGQFLMVEGVQPGTPASILAWLP